MSLRQTVKRALPPGLLDELRRVSGSGIRFAGDHGSWAEARAAATGYDQAQILERVRAATRAVVAGQAAFERDSVLFTAPDYAYPLLAGLLRAAARDGGRLRVIDFGGSLGSTFRQHLVFLRGLRELRWCVVEQPHFVAAGRAEFSTPELSFAETLQQVPWWGEPCVVLLSSVLQYLEDPQALLESLAQSGATSLIIDRTPVAEAPADRLCVQTVPPQIYRASYPCRIFARAALQAQLARHWELLAEFPSAEGRFSTRERFRFAFVGMLWEARR